MKPKTKAPVSGDVLKACRDWLDKKGEKRKYSQFIDFKRKKRKRL
jgi:hypothetical protein